LHIFTCYKFCLKNITTTQKKSQLGWYSTSHIYKKNSRTKFLTHMWFFKNKHLTQLILNIFSKVTFPKCQKWHFRYVKKLRKKENGLINLYKPFCKHESYSFFWRRNKTICLTTFYFVFWNRFLMQKQKTTFELTKEKKKRFMMVETLKNLQSSKQNDSD